MSTFGSEIWDEADRIAFASFLRRYPLAWRLRRRDYMCPIDFYLARRQITVQGELTTTLVGTFAEEQGMLASRFVDASSVGPLIYLPFATFAKHVLLDFTTYHSNGERMSLLTRSQSAQVTAGHLLTLLPKRARPRGSEERAALMIVLETLAATNPLALFKRHQAWLADPRIQLRDPAEQFNLWFEGEMRRFSIGLETETLDIRDRLRELREVQIVPRSPSISSDDLPFRSLGDLLTLSVGEVLQVVASRFPSQLQVDQPDNSELAERLGAFPTGLRVLARALEEVVRQPRARYEYLLGKLRDEQAQRPESDYLVRDLHRRHNAAARQLREAERLRNRIEEELLNTSVSWMAYLVVPMQLATPFHYRISEILPLRSRGFIRRNWRRLHTAQVYRFDPLDARSSHIEIAVDDPVLKIATRRTRVDLGKRHDQRYRLRRWNRPEDVFAQEFRQSERIIHFYASNRPFQEPYRDRSGRVLLRVQYNVVTTIRAAYWIAVGSILAAISYALYEWHGGTKAPSRRADMIALGLAFLAVVVAFMTAGERKPLAQGKLEGFRLLFCAAFVALATIVALWGFSSS